MLTVCIFSNVVLDKNDMWYQTDCTDTHVRTHKLNIEHASMGLAHITELTACTNSGYQVTLWGGVRPGDKVTQVHVYDVKHSDTFSKGYIYIRVHPFHTNQLSMRFTN